VLLGGHGVGIEEGLLREAFEELKGRKGEYLSSLNFVIAQPGGGIIGLSTGMALGPNAIQSRVWCWKRESRSLGISVTNGVIHALLLVFRRF